MCAFAGATGLMQIKGARLRYGKLARNLGH
jgi:hypothetical protein